LEALLKLKRAEKPDAQFWADFERGLRQRQLASIVEPKPWWLGLSLLARRSSPLLGGAALGAAAVLTVLFARLDFPGGETPALASSGVSSERAESGDATRFASLDSVQTGPGLASGSNGETDSGSLPVTESLAELSAAEAVASVAAASHEASISPARPTDDLVAEVVVVQASEPVVASIQVAESTPAVSSSELAAKDSEAWFVPSGQTAIEDDALAALPVIDSRQARLLASLDDSNAVSSTKALANVRDRILHRMNDGEELYAAISRVGVQGDRLSLKF
jgi:hypothetical protein